MKKEFRYLILAIILVFTLTACGRDLSTPSSRLVGHWEMRTAPPLFEVYIAEVDSKTGEGTITRIDADGTMTIGTYRVRSEQPDGENVKLSVSYPGSNSLDEILNFTIAEKGISGTLEGYPLGYVDDKTEP